MENRCIPGTIDAVLVGGQYVTSPQPTTDSSTNRDYLSSLKLLGTEVQNILHFEPVVINGPKNFTGADDIYYDNANRRLYFIRFIKSISSKKYPDIKINSGAKNFTPSEVDEHKEEWKQI